MISSPVEQRYHNDIRFRALVDYLEAAIHAAEFTPSELREAATLASCNYEMRRCDRAVFLVAEGRFVGPSAGRCEPPESVLVDGREYQLKPVGGYR